MLLLKVYVPQKKKNVCHAPLFYVNPNSEKEGAITFSLGYVLCTIGTVNTYTDIYIS